MDCHAVEEIVILSKDIRFTFGMSINGASSLKRVIFYAETPPENTDPSAYFFWYVNKDAVLYVPDGRYLIALKCFKSDRLSVFIL